MVLGLEPDEYVSAESLEKNPYKIKYNLRKASKDEIIEHFKDK